MKGEILFEKMTGISDEYVKEAALVTPVEVESGKKSRIVSRSTAWRRGLSAACIVLVAVVALLLGTATAGRIVTPAPEGTPPLARFGFAYELGGFDGTAMPGDTVCVDTTIINRGLPFVYHGSSASYHPDACFVLQDDESVSMQCAFMETCDSGPHAVTMGMEGRGYGEITIPADAVPGVYDLVLSYKGMTQVYKGVLTVGESEGETEGESETEPQPPVDTTDHPFSFGYELAGDAAPGTFYHMDTWVVNEGTSFTFEGSSMGFAPAAVLIHMETRYRIEGNFDVTTDFRQVTVNTGDKGQVTQEFMIPADAPTGVYALQLSYGGVTKSFAGVLTVAEPTVEAPAVLSNLTMPVGSEWLYEPIDEAYVPGELVTVRIQFATDVGTLFFLNGEVITTEVGDVRLGYWEYSFYMPDRDSEIIFQTYDGMAPYSDILEAYYTANPKAEGVQVSDYGTYGDGVRVAIIDDARFMYTQMEEEHRIGPAIIRYAYGNFMKALHNGQFYSLAEAYETGLLSDADMAALENLQRERNPYLYADSD